MPLLVDPGVVDHVVGDLRAAADDLSRQRADATARVESLLDGAWSGAAADAFAGGWLDWTRAADDVLEALLHLAALVEAARRGVTASDDRAEVSMAALAARLG